MATMESLNQALAKTTPQSPEQAQKEVENLLAIIQPQFIETLPKQMNSTRFMTIFKNNVLKNPKIAQCSPTSIVMAVLTSAQVGLEPDGKLAALIPYHNKFTGRLELQFQEMYQGVVELIYRDGYADSINAYEVRTKDIFEIDYGNTERPVVHKPCLLEDRGDIMGYYSIVRLKAKPGETPAVMAYYMSHKDILEHAKKHSKGFNKKEGKFSGVWATDEPPMCKKTVLLQLAKFIPKSPNLTKALEQDETSREYIKGFKNVLDVPVNTDWDSSKEIQTIENEPVIASEEASPTPPTAEVIQAENIEGTATKANENNVSDGGIDPNIDDMLRPNEVKHLDAVIARIVSFKTMKVGTKQSPKVQYMITDGSNEIMVELWGNPKAKDETAIKGAEKVRIYDLNYKTFLKRSGEESGSWTAKEIEIVK